LLGLALLDRRLSSVCLDDMVTMMGEPADQNLTINWHIIDNQHAHWRRGQVFMAVTSGAGNRRFSGLLGRKPKRKTGTLAGR